VPQRHPLRGVLLGLLCAALAGAFSVADPTFLGAEWLLRDAYSRTLAGRRTPDPRVVVVAVSERTSRVLDSRGYGRWPYPRSVWAAAVRELRRAGARVIVLDVGLGEEDIRHPDDDRELAEVLRGAPVVLGVQTQTGGRLPHDGGELAHDLWHIGGSAPTREDFGVILPQRAFRTTSGIGTIRLASSARSGIVHEYVLADQLGGSEQYVPGLALEAVRMYLGGPREARWTNDALRAGWGSIPMKGGRADLVWHGRSGPAIRYPVVGLENLLAANRRTSGVDGATLAALDAQFRGRIVVIGATAFGLFDLRATPLWPSSAGVEIHANAIDDLLNGTFLHDANMPAQVLLLLAIAAILGALFDAIRLQWLSGAVAMTAAAGWAATGFGMLAGGIVIRTVAGISSVVLTYGLVTVVKFTDEQRQTALLKTTFGHYVSPQILNHILAHPEKVRLGGERREITVLFSDIRGFTTISEASEPEAVVEMLNEYLDRMVEILIEHGGTLDKFIGDAVMGFWNAPALDPDHPRNAVRCAISMVQETAKLRARWETEGKPSIRIGIGINTGEAVVGNIGAERVFGYTVIGDAVNLASRLEGKNKDYGTSIIISEHTLARIAGEVDTVYLDDVKVKGREKGVKIYGVTVR
jgi:adenylate cyclase